MKNISTIKKQLRLHATDADKAARFFKTAPGHYAEHDLFLGISLNSDSSSYFYTRMRHLAVVVRGQRILCQVLHTSA